ncbi:hypothetical protein HanXRQr2_Chr08g0325791 [Helianthus annuus]|uniref:Uncharacterized protein n=1 Tax=Helianthus annuus TaxID=4232 RepID=A0A9K3ICV0_HELAN|nr:hypothetical protein HanXRQr2_Chr08g0325791 [Helianthus annuus]
MILGLDLLTGLIADLNQLNLLIFPMILESNRLIHFSLLPTPLKHSGSIQTCLMMGLSFLLQNNYMIRSIPSDDIVSKSQQARCAQDGNLPSIELKLRSRYCMLEWALEFK